MHMYTYICMCMYTKYIYCVKYLATSKYFQNYLLFFSLIMSYTKNLYLQPITKNEIFTNVLLRA